MDTNSHKSKDRKFTLVLAWLEATRPLHSALVMRANLIFLVSVLFFAGCASAPVNSADPAPRYASRIKVAIYDLTPRTPTTSLDVFDAPPSRPHKVIALLSHKAEPNDSAAMMNAIAWRARQLGAQGMIVLPPQDTGVRWNNWGMEKGEPIYSANAIVFTE
jgi:hypothetical protein